MICQHQAVFNVLLGLALSSSTGFIFSKVQFTCCDSIPSSLLQFKSEDLAVAGTDDKHVVVDGRGGFYDALAQGEGIQEERSGDQSADGFDELRLMQGVSE